MAAEHELAVEEIEYPESDGQPTAETDLHRDLMTDVILRLRERYAARTDVYVSGNLLVYYVEGVPQKCLAPDCFVAFGPPPGDRRVFKTWDEGVFPAVVFEITSKTTEREDVLTKFRAYQDVWKVKELFMFDPTEDYLEPSMIGYRRSRGALNVIRQVGGRIASKELGVTLERGGTRLVIRDATTGGEIPLPHEADARKARRQLRKSERDRERAEAQLGSANAELERLRAELAALRGQRPPPA